MLFKEGLERWLRGPIGREIRLVKMDGRAGMGTKTILGMDHLMLLGISAGLSDMRFATGTCFDRQNVYFRRC